jgi:hypothetical protein
MPAGNTYEAIATQTLGSAAATLTFSSIPSTYTDLVLVFQGGQTAGSVQGFNFQLNGDTGTNYSYTRIYGDGSAVYSDRVTSFTSGQIGNLTADLTTNALAHFQNYSNTTTYKTVLTRNNLPSSYVFAEVNLWRSTSAINQISIFSTTGNLLSGTVASLYGIKAA